MKVLVADDSPYNLFAMEELLKTLYPNIEILTAYNGKIAIELA
jgi:response regulator RpfG family c-di-GMP phosphodiesterase